MCFTFTFLSPPLVCRQKRGCAARLFSYADHDIIRSSAMFSMYHTFIAIINSPSNIRLSIHSMTDSSESLALLLATISTLHPLITMTDSSESSAPRNDHRIHVATHYEHDDKQSSSAPRNDHARGHRGQILPLHPFITID